MRGQGSVERLPSGRWRLRLPRALSRARTGATYDTEGEARAVLAELVRLNQEAQDRPRDTLAGWGEVVLARRQEQGLATAKDDAGRWAHVLDSDLAHMLLKAIQPQHVRDFARQLAKRPARRGGLLSRQTQQHILNLLRVVLEEARLDGRLPGGANPARDIKPALAEEGEDLDAWTWLRPEEIEQLLRCEDVPAEVRDLYAVAVYTGLRQGELWALTWADVQLDGPRPQITVARSGRRRTTKSKKVRAVPLLPAALDALRRLKERAHEGITIGALSVLRGRSGQAVFGTPRPSRSQEGLQGTPIATGPIFPGPDGRQRPVGDDAGWADKRRGEQAVQRGWRSVAGLRGDIRFHDLRHTCASHLLQGTWGRRWRLEEVRDFLGHSSITVTQRYAHLCAEALHEAAAATRREEQDGQQNMAPIRDRRGRIADPGSGTLGIRGTEHLHTSIGHSVGCAGDEVDGELRKNDGGLRDGGGGKDERVGGVQPSAAGESEQAGDYRRVGIERPTDRPTPIAQQEGDTDGAPGRDRTCGPRLRRPHHSSAITPTYAPGGPDVGRLAEEVIQRAAAGEDLPADLAEQLARAVLADPLVAAALAVLQGGDLAYAHALRLAGLVLRRRQATPAAAARTPA